MLWIDAIANYELDVVFLSVFFYITAVTKIETRRLIELITPFP